MIYVTDRKHEADLKVYEESSKYRADLLYYLSEKNMRPRAREMLFGVIQKKNMRQKKRYIGKKVNIKLI